MKTDETAPPRTVGFLLVNGFFVGALVLIGAVSAWPIYESTSYIVLAVASCLLAVAISLVSLWQRWSWFTTTIVAVGVYLLLGVPLAMPGSLNDLSALPSSWVQFIVATVFGWKQLVTVTIPVGTYQALLVPAFALFLAVAVAALSLSWRSRRLYALAVPLLFLIPLFGLAFGSSGVSTTVRLPWFEVTPREFLIGLLALVVSLGFLAWRARQARHSALRLGAAALIHQGRGSRAGSARRAALAVVMLVAAVLVAGSVVPQLAGNDRQVLRTAVAPEINLSEFVSPLTQYRSYLAGDRYTEELFAVDGGGDEATRLRLAVLGYYDGTVYRVVDPKAPDDSRSTTFARIPSRLHPAGEEAAQRLGVEVGAYSGVWLPTAGALASIAFSGEGANALADHFFYNAHAGAGVELQLLGQGDSYTLETVLSEPIALASIEKPAAPEGLVDDALIPESLVDWVRSQSVGTDAAALQELVDRLRNRGYLSHALTEPVGADSAWMTDLGSGYVFEPSLAGHSVDRIDALFGALVLKQNDTRSSEDADLVAAVGDDEQFAVATALLAQYLGFPSRVVLGFDLDGPSPGASTGVSTPSCENGSCRGEHLIAWVEVRGADGRWATVDVTPQHENVVAPLDNEQQDPENLTEVVPETATVELPPEANPAGGDQSDQNAGDIGPNLAWLADTLKIVGISLLSMLVLLAPFLTVVLAKARRRRERLRAPEVEGRIVGGWDEYVDAALDHGKPAPMSETRSELAALYGTPRAQVLASIADQAVFDSEAPDAQTADRFWAIVEAERRSLSAGQSRWQRIRSAVSVRSFTRHAAFHPLDSKRYGKEQSQP